MTVRHEQLSDAQIKKFAAKGAAWTEDQALEAAGKFRPGCKAASR